MLNCREVLEQADVYLANELSDWQRFQFKLHLGLCRHCRRYLKNLRLTQQVSQQLTLAAPIPSDSELDVLMLLIQQGGDKR